MNNLYLFLTNEQCYEAFNNFLSKGRSSGVFYLKLYTHIMKYKLDFVLKVETGLEVAREIYNTYFKSSKYEQIIDAAIIEKIRKECKGLDNNVYTSELFDEALQFAFTELGKRFIDFKNSPYFKELYEELNLNSYIQCKMCNTGLINKF